MSGSAIPMAVGWTWTSTLSLILNLLVGGVLVAIVKSRPALKKIANEREANLLHERAVEMESMRARLAKIEAERAVDRHRLNNVTQCLDALLLLIEQDPAKAQDAAARIRLMRAEQVKAEALEKGAIHAEDIRGATV